jgi:zinc transport system ATP-binding protein
MNDEKTAISVENVTFSYSGQKIIDHASFSINRGDFLGIIGPNGGGKTTLLRLMLGLLKPDSGTITVCGVSPVKQRGRIGYIPQETGQNKTFPISVFDVVLMGLSGRRGLGRRYTHDDRNKAGEMIGRLGLSALVKKPIAQLSGGQRQRALLARAMVANPEMLFLDEPTANVDTQGEGDIYKYLKQLNDTGVTIVLVTHNTNVLSQYVRSVACINRELYFHPDGHLDHDSISKTFGCQVDLIAHGIPHRVFHEHTGEVRHD